MGANFEQTGTHYVWVRAWALGGGDDSVHFGLDGAVLGTSDRIQVSPAGGWA